MEELETSGLLKDENPAAESLARDGQEQWLPAPSAAADEQPDVRSPQKSETDAGTTEAENRDAGEASGSAQAEQRVLGALEGCPGWHEVMDMASGSVYFWNEDTNEVAWDPPDGALPRSKESNRQVFAEAHAEKPQPEDDTRQPDARAQSEVPGRQKTKEGAGVPDDGVSEGPESFSLPATKDKDQPDQVQSPEEAEVVSGSDQEEGQLNEEPAVEGKVPDAPLEEVGQAGEALLQRVWEAAESLCGPTPLLVRLAVEVEVRLREWKTLSDRQRQAAEAGSPDMALSWASYQQLVQQSWRVLEEALPAALEEAQRQSTAAAAAMAEASAAAAAAAAPPTEPDREDGEVPEEEPAPPLPSEIPAPLEDMDVDMDIEADPVQKKDSGITAAGSASTAAVQAPVSSAAPANQGVAASVPQPLPVYTAATMRPGMMAPLPMASPQWLGYYHQYMAYPHYAFYRPLLLPGHVPYPGVVQPTAAAAQLASAAEAHPPLPADTAPSVSVAASHPLTQPQLPSGGQTVASSNAIVGAAAQMERGKEYRAEPVCSAAPAQQPAATEDSVAAGLEPAAAVDEDKKRKREKAGAAKKKKVLKVGKTTSSLIDKWAAVRKDLVRAVALPCQARLVCTAVF
jgi:hypothetical protein